jgi:hypothetical protein
MGQRVACANLSSPSLYASSRKANTLLDREICAFMEEDAVDVYNVVGLHCVIIVEGVISAEIAVVLPFAYTTNISSFAKSVAIVVMVQSSDGVCNVQVAGRIFVPTVVL